jgi:hypothetical protein
MLEMDCQVSINKPNRRTIKDVHRKEAADVLLVE